METFKFWVSYIAFSIIFGSFVSMMVRAVGAPQGTELIAGIAAGVLALVFVVYTWVRHEKAPSE